MIIVIYIKGDIMARRFILNGSTEEKIITCLKAAGWYKGRCVDLAEVKAWYSTFGITLPEYAKNFLKEYYGISDSWYINEPEEESCNRAPDIEFSLYPTNDEDVDEEADEDDEDASLWFSSPLAKQTTAFSSLAPMRGLRYVF